MKLTIIAFAAAAMALKINREDHDLIETMASLAEAEEQLGSKMKTPDSASVTANKERHSVVNYINDDMRRFYADEEKEAKEQTDTYAEAEKEVNAIRSQGKQAQHLEAMREAEEKAAEKAPKAE